MQRIDVSLQLECICFFGHKSHARSQTHQSQDRINDTEPLTITQIFHKCTAFSILIKQRLAFTRSHVTFKYTVCTQIHTYTHTNSKNSNTRMQKTDSKSGITSPTSASLGTAYADIQQRKFQWRKSVLNSLGSLSPHESPCTQSTDRRQTDNGGPDAEVRAPVQPSPILSGSQRDIFDQLNSGKSLFLACCRGLVDVASGILQVLTSRHCIAQIPE